VAAPWVGEELQDVSLGDKRLNDRLAEILSQLGARPTASIPAACGGYAELAAAYRFFDNDKVGLENILRPHIDATRRRIAAQPVVLLVNDTTEIDLTRPRRQVTGAGPLDGSARRGVSLHLMHAFTPDGTPLGTVQATAWARDEEKPSTAALSRAERAATPFEDKESHRWLVSVRQARDEGAAHPGTHVVYVADSEADVFEVIAAGMEGPRTADWIVRACQDRATVADGPQAVAAADHLRDEVLTAPVLSTKTIRVRGRQAKIACEDRGRRQPRESRTATVEVRAARVTLRGPRRPGGKLPDVSVNVVLVREVDPPAADVAVEWMLLTSLAIDTVEQVDLIVQYYCIRWMVEVFFKVLKSGCRVEERRFEHTDRLLPCLAVYLIVAWRTLYVCRLGREFPEINCEAVFEPSEWRSIYPVVKGEPPPKEPPSLREMIRTVAQLGGYVNKPRRDEPGPQTVWLGLQRLHDIARCWDLFGPGANKEAGVV
jgi:Transposase DNA-binding/Transposase Tn5 dimerisation domain/Transposase DDE domain